MVMMITRIVPQDSYAEDLKEILQQGRKYNMRLNPAKYTFGVQAWNF